ncbi:MAG: ABC transporter permease [Brevinematales bacterium]
MRITLLLGLRNLLRQKRRNFLLALIIAFGMSVLIMSGSTGDGMTDIMLNNMLVNWVGHIQVTIFEKMDKNGNIIRDRDKIMGILRGSLRDVKTIKESFDLWPRVIGNGRAADIYLASVDPTKEFFGTLRLESGNSADFTNSSIENAVIMSRTYAKRLRVRVNDYVSVSLKTINGQVQTAKLRITGINSSSGTIWNTYSVYIKTADLKRIMGYGENETSSLRVILKDIETTRDQAKILYKALEPGTACIPLGGPWANFSLLGFSTNDADIKLLKGLLNVSMPLTNRILIGAKAAAARNLSPGMIIELSYTGQDKARKTCHFVIGGLFSNLDRTLNNAILLNENDFKEIYYKNIPDSSSSHLWDNSPALRALVKEWVLMPRARTSDEIENQYDSLIKDAKKDAYLVMTTVYEDNYGILQWASIAQMISLAAVVILFIITQVGVLNTLRMSVRERTREIGTMRSIGMQKNEIRDLFIGETLLLTFFASILGICLAYAAMALISSFYIDTTSEAFSIFLLNSRVHFITSPLKVLLYIVILQVIAFISAYFPARKAAALSPSAALRHYE